MSNVMEFGFDDAKVIKHQGIEQLKFTTSGERAKVSIISFKRFHDTILSIKAREKGSALTDEEKATILANTDKKLAEQLKKEVSQLTEVDRLDIKQPKFSYAYTHFDQNKKDGVGTIRCLSVHQGNTLVKPELCCDRFGDAEQTVATVVVKYPVDKDNMQVETDIFKAKKMTEVLVWRMSAKKFKNLETAYIDARNDKKFCVDLLLQLEGDPQFKGIKVTAGGGATWAREDMDPEVRNWILDQGLRAWKHVTANLGFEISKEKLAERLSGASGGGGQAAKLNAADEAGAQPKVVADYDNLLT